MTAPMRTPERGLVVGSRYRLESVLGEGGMAVVWNAVHTETDRKVALKLVRADFVTHERVREMFVQEARVAARIGKSDHIVDVLDAGVDDGLGVPFIAMELLVGETLERRLKRGPVPPRELAELLEQLADALEQAHGAGVFHRDLKPANLFLTTGRKGQPLLKVLDFGIAKLADSAAQSTTHVGTPAYSAPEQLGESWRAIGAQRQKVIAAQVSAGTDVWAVGLIAFESLTGAPAGAFWGAQTLAELPVKIVLEPLPLVATRADARLMPQGFDGWLGRCLDLDARKRWPGARAAVDALTPLLRGNAASVAPLRVSAAAPVAPASPPVGAPPPAPFGPPMAAPMGPPPGTVPPAAWPSPRTHAGDPRLGAWAAHRRADLRAPGDPRAFGYPVVHLPRVEHVGREARLTISRAVVVIADVVASDAFRKAVGEDRMLVALMQSPELHYRAAVRSKRSSGGLIDGVARGLKALDALIAPNAAGVLGDPAFEQHFEVTAPTPREAHAAVPVSLRHALVSSGFHGIIERFPGAIMMTRFDATQFEPASLDRVLDACSRVLGAIPT